MSPINKLTASLHAYIADPYLISDTHTYVFILGLLPQLYLAYLLFSPRDTRLLRRLLLVPTIAFSLWAAYSFALEDPIRLGQTLGMRALASWFMLRACEIGIKSGKPRWIGHEGDGRRTRGAEHRDGGAEKKEGTPPHSDCRMNDPRTRWQQFVLGISYFFAFRLNLGWSDSLATPALVPPFRPVRRRTLVFRHLTGVIIHYLVWDIALGLMEAAPVLRTSNRRAEGSVWDPIVWADGKIVLPPLVSAVYMTLIHILTLSIGIGFDHQVICLFYSLFHPGTPVAAPPVFNNLLTTTSIEQLWSTGWHQSLKSSFLNLLGRPLRSLARRLGFSRSIQHLALFLGVFAASGLQHGLFTYLPHYKDRETSRAYMMFFVYQPLLIGAERLFTSLTGRRVRGLGGAAWTWMVIIWTGMPVVDAYFRLVGTVGHGGGREGETLMPFGAVGRVGLRWLLGWK